MIWWDLFIVVLYGLIVFLILSQAIEALDKQATITLNQAKLTDELTSRGLKDTVRFIFGFNNPYSLANSLKVLAISVANTSGDRTLYVDWDRSALTDLGGRSRRVIRLTPDKNPDLGRPQVWSVIPPGQILQEVITAEDVLNQSTVADSFDLAGAIVPIGAAGAGRPLIFYLCIWLIVQQKTLGAEDEHKSQTLVPCEFVICKCPWTDALPW